MLILIIVLLLYAVYSIYMDSRKKKIVEDLVKAVNQAQAISEENNRNFERVIERLEKISPQELERDYFFEKHIDGQSRMFTAPVRYIQERDMFVISATDAQRYKPNCA